ncbi:hypothetical protein Mapa_011579 [Marchantia paleacea]|nr:hypothetical protein Mapa_011579 [Marchantia paleacea]
MLVVSAEQEDCVSNNLIESILSSPMSPRRRKPSARIRNHFPAHSPTKNSFADSLKLGTNLPHQRISNFAELQSEMLARLQALKTDMDHEHIFMVKATEAHTAKLKKRVKQETQESSHMSRAIDTDWKNFLADFEEDARENQESVETLLRKAENSAAYFSETCILELTKTLENKLNEIKNRYNRPTKGTRRLSAREKGKTIRIST